MLHIIITLQKTRNLDLLYGYMINICYRKQFRKTKSISRIRYLAESGLGKLSSF